MTLSYSHCFDSSFSVLDFQQVFKKILGEISFPQGHRRACFPQKVIAVCGSFALCSGRDGLQSVSFGRRCRGGNRHNLSYACRVTKSCKCQPPNQPSGFQESNRTFLKSFTSYNFLFSRS